MLVPVSPTQQPNNTAASPSEPPTNSTFDYLYEFSETRKVLEEFFKHSDTDSTKHDFQVGAFILLSGASGDLIGLV